MQLRDDDRSLVHVVSWDYRVEGIRLSQFPMDQWNGRVVHGFVIVHLRQITSQGRVFVPQAHRFVGITRKDYPSTTPEVTVTMVWREGRPCTSVDQFVEFEMCASELGIDY